MFFDFRQSYIKVEAEQVFLINVVLLKVLTFKMLVKPQVLEIIIPV